MSDRVAETLVFASCPGGMAKQFRVQISSGETPSRWKLAGSFRDSQSAIECVARLKLLGHQARVLACHALPTAA